MIKPQDVDANDKLTSCFGKFEMECAARKIIALAKEANKWNVPLTSNLFEGENEIEGFLDLEWYGWFTKDDDNRCYVRLGFIQRLEAHINKSL